MKFYTSVGPNPRVVKMFAVERGIDLPSETVDLRGGDNRRPPYTDINALILRSSIVNWRIMNTSQEVK